jgi:DNA adenine methylase
MSNSSAQFIKEIYQDFTVHVVKATRSINSKGSGRSGIDELLICNYTV